MRSNRNSSNNIEPQRAAINSQGNGANNNNRGRPGALLPPIDKKGQKVGSKQNIPPKEEKKPEDKYEQMRNRSKNNADRHQKLKDIRNQYTLKKGKDKAVKSEGREQQNSNSNDNNEFEIFEMERVENNEENVANILQNKKNNINTNNAQKPSSNSGNQNVEDDIEELEKELARLKMDIHEKEESITQLDQLQQKAQENQEASNYQSNPGQQQKQQQQQQPDLKNMVFGQRVKGKDMNDYWNNQDQKTTYKVQQNPGGASQVTIGGDYNFFKDKENEQYKASKQRNNYQPPQQGGQQSYENEDYSRVQQRKNKDEQISGKKHYNNDQNYAERKEQQNLQTQKQQQQALYAQELQEQIASKKGPPKGQIQSINIFEGYSGRDDEPRQQKGGQQQQASQFINSLYYHQDKEPKNNNIQGKYNNNQTSVPSADEGKKIIRVTQPPGGRSQIVFG